MNRFVTVFQSTSVIIERFDHPAHCVHRDYEAERTKDIAVTFVEKGTFALQESGESWAFRAGDVLASTPGRIRQYRHFEECPEDVCLSISFAPETVEDALGTSRKPSPPPHIGQGPVTDFAHLQIHRAVGSRDSLWIEEMAFHSLLALAKDAWNCRNQQIFSAAHRHRIQNAVEFMSQEFTGRCSLTSISRKVGMSPFHFARTFSGLVGLSPHQYLLRLRLRHSAVMLRQGASVTTAALNSGFDNLSHFSRSFRVRFGVNPSKYPCAQGQPHFCALPRV
jgi:AraC family transcriptional regulator